MFAHCQTAADVWSTYHAVACLCHPAQGGHADDMRALTAEARARLGAAWPAGWPATPNLFDLFCVATGTPNPFGSVADVSPPPCASSPRGYEPARALAPWRATGMGRILAVFAA